MSGGNQTPLGRMNVYLGGTLRYGMAGWIGNEVISPAW